MTPADPQKDALLSVKQEPEDKASLGSLGLQEITLDDGRKLRVFTISHFPLRVEKQVSES